MAAAAEVRQGELEEELCPVCKDPSARDPRVMDCGHHFCRSCLEKLVVDNTITCPTCRYVTQVNTDVSGLAILKTTNKFSLNVEKLMQRQTGDIDKLCVKCDGEKKEATKTCMECPVNLCNECAPNHEQVEQVFTHKMFPISTHMFCENHDDQGVKFYCVTCNFICCLMCVMGEHKGHQLEKITITGEKANKRLMLIREEMDAAQGEETLTKTLKCLLMKAKATRETFKTSIKSIQTALNNLSAKLNQVNEEVNTKMAATIKTLEMMSSDIGDYMTSKVSLRELLTYLIEGASSPEVVAREKELPKYDMTTYKQVIHDKEMEIPELGDTFSEIKEKLERCQQQLDITFTKHNVCGPLINLQKVTTIQARGPQYDTKPLINLQKVTTVQAGNYTRGLTVDSDRQRLVVRRMDATSPISVYDFQGQQLHVLGQNVDGIAKTDNQSIAIDSARDLYLVPMADGTLVTLHTQGGAMGNIIHVTANDKQLHGVGYSDHGNQDIYLVSSYNSNQVFLVDADSHQVMTSFSPSTTFSYPLSLCDGHFYQGTTKHPVIIVSNYSSHCIKLMDSSGRLLHTYGKEEKTGQGEGELCHPFGVCTDPAGRIIVADMSNHRVVALCREDGKDKWETLLDKDKLGVKSALYHVICDQVSRNLFVGYQDGTIHVYQ